MSVCASWLAGLMMPPWIRVIARVMTSTRLASIRTYSKLPCAFFMFIVLEDCKEVF